MAILCCKRPILKTLARIFSQEFKKSYRHAQFGGIAILLSVIIFLGGAHATEKGLNKNGGEKKIHVNADRLTVDGNTRCLEFDGNVKATQEDMIITSDHLKIFYEHNPAGNQEIAIDPETIKEIIATGNVQIKFDNRLAVTEQAVYNTQKAVIVLTGKDSKVMTEDSYIAGEKITVNRNDGLITFERGSKGPVEALIHTGENGLKKR